MTAVTCNAAPVEANLESRMSDSESTGDGAATQHEDWPKVLEWIEKQGQDNLKARFTTNDILAKEVQTTLTVLLAAVGASAAHGIKIFEAGPSGPVVLASAVVCVYLIAVSAVLVCGCMMFRWYPALSQDPKNLLQPEHALTDLREAELRNLSDRIEAATKINAKRARRLNRVRFAALASPGVFALAAAIGVAAGALPQAPFTMTCEPLPASPASAPAASKFKCHVSN
jgi:hypothetical protein